MRTMCEELVAFYNQPQCSPRGHLGVALNALVFSPYRLGSYHPVTTPYAISALMHKCKVHLVFVAMNTASCTSSHKAPEKTACSVSLATRSRIPSCAKVAADHTPAMRESF